MPQRPGRDRRRQGNAMGRSSRHHDNVSVSTSLDSVITNRRSLGQPVDVQNRSRHPVSVDVTQPQPGPDTHPHRDVEFLRQRLVVVKAEMGEPDTA